MTDATLSSITLTPPSASVAAGVSQQYVATANYSDNSSTNISDQANWSTDASGVAAISPTGNASTSMAGTALITATYQGQTGQATLNVTAATLSSITLTPNEASVAAGISQQYVATANYSDNSTQDVSTQAAWSSGTPGTAAISNSGLATTLASGTTVITATYSGQEAQVTLTVTAATLSSINITPTNASVGLGGTVQYMATGVNSDGKTFDLSSAVIWSTGSAGIASVDANGLVAGIAQSNTSVIATSKDNSSITNSVPLTVTAPTLSSIELSLSETTATVGDSINCSVTGTYSDKSTQTIANDQISWSSSDEGIPISKQGIISANHAGSTDITASINGLDSKVTLTVNEAPPVLVSIYITPGNPIITIGIPKPLKVMGQYTTGPDQDLTGQVNWTVSDPAIATIDGNGSITGLIEGSITVTANYPGMNGNTTVTVEKPPSISAPAALNLLPITPFITATPTTLVVTNNSASTIVTNIKATLPGDWSDVTQDASNCGSVAPGYSCQLVFTASSTTHTNTSIPISGDGVPTINTYMAVNQPWVTDNTVQAIVPDLANNRIYIGGSFSYLGPYTGNAVPIDKNSNQLMSKFPQVNGSVNTIISDGANGWYIGGSFTQVDSTSIKNLAHIKADYSVDANFRPNPDQNVACLVLGNGLLYVGGIFNNIGGQTSNGLAAVDPNSGISNGWNPYIFSFNAQGVAAMALSGNTLYIGGGFEQIAMNSIGWFRNGLAAFDISAATPTPTDWNPDAGDTGPNSFVGINSLAVNGNTVYIGGSFVSIGGKTIGRLAAVDATSGAVINNSGGTPWNPNAKWGGSPSLTKIVSIVVKGNIVYVAGLFDSIGGQNVKALAAIDATTGLAANWSTIGNTETVSALFLDGNMLYAAGNFTTISGQSRTRIAQWDISSVTTLTPPVLTTWTPPRSNAAISAIAISGSTLYLGGSFTSLGGQAYSRIAALEASSGIPISSWHGTVVASTPTNGTVYTLLLKNNTLFVGGQFTSINGQNVPYLAALDSNTGDLIPGWNSNADRRVLSLAIYNNILYAGGLFTNIGGQAHKNLAALNIADGSAVTTWKADANATVIALAISTDGKTLYAGGTFTTIRGQARTYLAAVDTSTGIPTDWNPAPDSSVSALTVKDSSTIYVGGSFSSIGDPTTPSQPQSVYGLAKVDLNTGEADPNWNPGIDNEVYSIAAPDCILYSGSSTPTCNVYIGGLFENLGSQTTPGVGVVDANNATPAAWSPNLTAGLQVNGVAVIGNIVYIGGNFTSVNNAPQQGFSIIPGPVPLLTP